MAITWQNRIIPPAIALMFFLSLWEFLSDIHFLNPILVPSPLAILKCLRADGWEFQRAVFETTFAAGAGFFMSALVGLSIAVIFSQVGWAHRALFPYAVFFQTVPIIAIAPLLVIWLGYGVTCVVASAFIVSIFPMIAASLTGLTSADPLLSDLFTLYGATRFDRLFKLHLPTAASHILVGLKIVAGLAVIGTVVGEFITGVGLGGVIDVARTQQRVDKVFAAIFLISILGLAALLFVNLLQLRLKRWVGNPVG